MNKSTIPRSIYIIQELAKRLELLDKIIKCKLILLKEDLLTILNH